jgi:2-keto-4-pentenoate hydratase
MTEPRSDPRGVAQALLQGRREQRPVDAAPLAGLLHNAADAYAVQGRVARELQGPGGVAMARYWKSGGPSREAVLTHAPLPPEGVWTSPADARGWHFNARLIEAEIALRIARDVSPQQAAALTPEHAGELIDVMTVSIEIVDSRWQQGPRDAPALLKLADLQSHGALVLGAWRPYQPRDWTRQECEVRIGDQGNPHRFRGSHSLADPAWLLPTWLRHATRDGQAVPGSTVVTTGTWCGMLPAATGDQVIVRFEGVGEASVQL